MWFGRSIPANKSTAQPSVIITVDCEARQKDVPRRSDQVDMVFRLGHARYLRLEGGKPTRRDELDFTDIVEFWEWIASKGDPRRPMWIWCHNAAADLVWLEVAELMAMRPPLLSQRPAKDGFWESPTKAQQQWSGFTCLEDPPTMLRLMHFDGFTINFMDLMNWLPFSLEAIAGWTGDEKTPLPEWDEPDDVWMTHCRRDVVLLEQAVLKVLRWVKDNDLGMFRYTLASQSLAAWRHKHREIPIRPHKLPAVERFEREGYFGGVNDLLYKGLVRPASLKEKQRLLIDPQTFDQRCYGPVHELDCTSLYAHLCATMPLPSALLAFDVAPEPAYFDPACLAEDCLAEVLVSTLKDSYPVRTEDGICSPLGDYWTVLCGPELLRAIRAGQVLGVRRWCRYELTPCLQSFMEHVLAKRYQAKSAGNDVESTLWKLLGNALPGKFGQRPSAWVDRPGYKVHEPWTYEYDIDKRGKTQAHYRAVGWLGQERVEGQSPAHTLIALPAFVTSYGREHMRHLVELAGPQQVLYVCADAIYVTDIGRQRLDQAGWIQENTPGKLRIEHSGHSADFRGIGHLRLGTLWKRAGIPRSARILGAARVQWNQWDGLETSWFDGHWSTVRVTKQNQSPPLDHWRGEVCHEGWIDRLVFRDPVECPYPAGEVRPSPMTSTPAASGARL